MTPVYRDILTYDSFSYFKYIILFNTGLIYSCSPKVFSPFINFIIGRSVHSNGRTAVNSLTYVSQLLFTSVMMNVITPIYTWSMTNYYMLKLFPFNKTIISHG